MSNKLSFVDFHPIKELKIILIIFKLKANEINNELINKKIDKITNEQKNLINFVFTPVVCLILDLNKLFRNIYKLKINGSILIIERNVVKEIV